MQLIPVLDIKDGIVVHAKLGVRAQYAPIQSPLCASSAVVDVINAFLTLAPFKIVYIADLNAIMQNGNNAALLEKLLQTYPQLTFWIDSGYQAAPHFLSSFPNYQTVLGSESYSAEKLPTLALFEKNFILSLDFTDQPLGAARLFTDPSLWPEKIIVMTLAQVGSGLGVDKQTLQKYQALGKNKTVIASGGIRDKFDVIALKESKITYALCASALHSGAITSADFAFF